MDTLEKLVLLEIMVDNVYFEKTALDPELLQRLQDTNVRFQFFDFPPIDIGEIDFCQTADGYERSEISFKSGKSVLFALPDTPAGIGDSFDLNVTVSRKYVAKKGDQVEAKKDTELKLFDLGKTIIHLGESFVNLIDATSYDGVCPTSRTMRDSYPFTNSEGNIAGYVTVFIRLSCFGKIIVTQFQADGLEEKDKSFCFKGGEDEGAPETPSDTDIYEKRPLMGPDAMMGFGPMMGPGAMMQPPFMMPGAMPSMYPQTINVPVPLKKREVVSKCGKVPSELVSSDSDGEKKGPYCLHRKCPQGLPLPPWVAGGRKLSKRKRPGPPVGSALFQGEDVVFQMSNPVGQGDIANKGNTLYKINAEPGQNQQLVQLMEPDFKPEADDEHDVFLLRFGKTDAQNKPAKLILTMKTPKVPILKPHKCTSDQATLTECEFKKVPARLSTAVLTTKEVAEALGKTSASETDKSDKPAGKGKKKKSKTKKKK